MSQSSSLACDGVDNSKATKSVMMYFFILEFEHHEEHESTADDIYEYLNYPKRDLIHCVASTLRYMTSVNNAK